MRHAASRRRAASPASARRRPTLAAHTLAAVITALLLVPAADGQTLGRYRAFELGATLQSVLMATGLAETDVKTPHQRPAVLQELEWRPSRWAPGSVTQSTDPVDQIRFSFYDGQLFRIVINYDRDRTAGLTASDIASAVSATYGLASGAPAPGAGRDRSALDVESGEPLARWRDADSTVVLYRTMSYGDTWRLIVTRTAIDALARRAQAQAEKLDAIDAPRREREQAAAERERARAAAEKARTTNQPIFTP